MNTYNINDPKFINTDAYRNFMASNSGRGNLRIRAYAASQAIPISNVKIVVSKVIEGNNIIFFEGYTNESGLIDRITLPAPRIDPNNLDVPNRIMYDVRAIYQQDNINNLYLVSIYDNVYVVQNISIVPEMDYGMEGF